jgi:hypothetical protein
VGKAKVRKKAEKETVSEKSCQNWTCRKRKESQRCLRGESIYYELGI